MKPLKDYSFVRGVCHNPDPQRSQEELEKELGFAQRLQINSVRFWMSEEDWKKDPEGYKDLLRNFMETCRNFGISSMPIFWNGNFIQEFKEPSEEEYATSEAYARDIIEAFGREEYILMWDVINEPMCNDYIRHCKGEEYDRRFDEITRYVRRLCGIIRKLDPAGCMTVGHEQVRHCVSTNDLVDVISFHDYLTTRKQIEDAVIEAEAFSKQFGKPVLNTETGCVGRANPYEVELEILTRHHVGWYLFTW